MKAQNPDINTETLSKIIKNAGIWTKRAVASHQSASSDILFQLAKDSDTKVRKNVAGNPNTSTETLDLLSKDSDGLSIKLKISSHLNSSAETLDLLSKDSNMFIRHNVENNPRANQSTIENIRNNCSKTEDEIQDSPNIFGIIGLLLSIMGYFIIGPILGLAGAVLGFIGLCRGWCICLEGYVL